MPKGEGLKKVELTFELEIPNDNCSSYIREVLAKEILHYSPDTTHRREFIIDFSLKDLSLATICGNTEERIQVEVKETIDVDLSNGPVSLSFYFPHGKNWSAKSVKGSFIE